MKNELEKQKKEIFELMNSCNNSNENFKPDIKEFMARIKKVRTEIVDHTEKIENERENINKLKEELAENKLRHQNQLSEYDKAIKLKQNRQNINSESLKNQSDLKDECDRLEKHKANLSEGLLDLLSDDLLQNNEKKD